MYRAGPCFRKCFATKAGSVSRQANSSCLLWLDGIANRRVQVAAGCRAFAHVLGTGSGVSDRYVANLSLDYAQWRTANTAGPNGFQFGFGWHCFSNRRTFRIARMSLCRPGGVVSASSPVKSGVGVMRDTCALTGSGSSTPWVTTTHRREGAWAAPVGNASGTKLARQPFSGLQLRVGWGFKWSGRQDSNLRSPAPKAGALATTLRPVVRRRPVKRCLTRPPAHRADDGNRTRVASLED